MGPKTSRSGAAWRSGAATARLQQAMLMLLREREIREMMDMIVVI